MPENSGIYKRKTPSSKSINKRPRFYKNKFNWPPEVDRFKSSNNK